MTDIRIAEGPQNLEAVTMDFLLLDTGLLDEREEMATSARVALGTDRLASVDEVLPDPDSTDRRGWWGDLEAEDIWGGWPIGCKNWLLTRAKITEAPSREGSTLQRARQYTQDALQPFIDKKVATLINVSADRTELNRIEVMATIFRGPLEEIDLRYQVLWQDDSATPSNIAIVAAPPSITDRSIIIPGGNLLLSSMAVLRSNTINIPSGNLLLSSVPVTAVSSKMPFRRTDWPNPNRLKPNYYNTVSTNTKILAPVVLPVGNSRRNFDYAAAPTMTWWYGISYIQTIPTPPPLDFVVGGKRWTYDYDQTTPTSWWYAKNNI